MFDQWIWHQAYHWVHKFPRSSLALAEIKRHNGLFDIYYYLILRCIYFGCLICLSFRSQRRLCSINLCISGFCLEEILWVKIASITNPIKLGKTSWPSTTNAIQIRIQEFQYHYILYLSNSLKTNIYVLNEMLNQLHIFFIALYILIGRS